MHLPILGRNTFTNRANYILTWHRLNIATDYSNRFVPNLLNHYTNLGRFLGTRKAYRDYRLMAGLVPKPTINTGIAGKSKYTHLHTHSDSKFHQEIYHAMHSLRPILPFIHLKMSIIVSGLKLLLSSASIKPGYCSLISESLFLL